MVSVVLADAEHEWLKSQQGEQLADLAMMVGDELDDTAESRRAAAIHQSFVPLVHPSADGYELAGLCVPARSVGVLGLPECPEAGSRGVAGHIAATVRAAGRGPGVAERVVAAFVERARRGPLRDDVTAAAFHRLR